VELEVCICAFEILKLVLYRNSWFFVLLVRGHRRLNAGAKWVYRRLNAMGWCIPPFVIVQGAYHLASWTTESGFPNDWVIKPTLNGWTDNETGLEWIRHFDKHTKQRTKGTYRMLIVDGHQTALHKTGIRESNNGLTTPGAPVRVRAYNKPLTPILLPIFPNITPVLVQMVPHLIFVTLGPVFFSRGLQRSSRS
jgi:hypothetical protein